MITVYSVLWGDKYPLDYVYTLQRMVARHLSVPHRFVCITDHELEGIETIRPPHPEWEGWWQKLQLFGLADGPSLYFDLDVVITGSLDYLVEYAERCRLAAPANWARSGHGGIQSSVLAWDGTYREPFEGFTWPDSKGNLWGDQEYLTQLLGDDFVKLPGIYSFKYHCRVTGLPDDATVAVFHGKPDPHEVGDPWVIRARQ